MKEGHYRWYSIADLGGIIDGVILLPTYDGRQHTHRPWQVPHRLQNHSFRNHSTGDFRPLSGSLKNSGFFGGDVQNGHLSEVDRQKESRLKGWVSKDRRYIKRVDGEGGL